MLLAIDPGKTCGWAIFDDRTGLEFGRGVIPYDKLHELFDILLYADHTYRLWWRPEEWNVPGSQLRVNTIVAENYIGRPGQKNGGQLFWASEALGRLDMLATLAGLEVQRQRAVDVIGSKANPGPAVLQSGYVQTSKHLPDQDSAYLHGFYYLVKQGVLRPKPLDP